MCRRRSGGAERNRLRDACQPRGYDGLAAIPGDDAGGELEGDPMAPALPLTWDAVKTGPDRAGYLFAVGGRVGRGLKRCVQEGLELQKAIPRLRLRYKPRPRSKA